MTNLANPFIKSVSINDLPDEAWTYLTGRSGDAADLQKYYKAIPWLFRGVDIRANAVATMPFSIYKGETEVDTSGDYQNKVGFLPNPGTIFGLIEAALTIWGRAYLFKQQSAFLTKGVRYLLPTSIVAEINPDTGEVGFIRTVAGKRIPMTVDEVVYFWQRDPFVEIGPPDSSPAQAAAAAAGVLLNVDLFAAGFFERGAIKATLLTTTNILPAERDRLKSWWQRMFARGSKTSWQTDIVNADAVTPVVVGEGLESLENDALTESKRIDIAAALGIPYSVLFSNASNRATAEQDDLHLYSKTIVPECRFIESVLNTQLFDPLGFKLKFTEENLDVYQEDEEARAQSLSYYIGALEKPKQFLIAARILGIEYDAEIQAEIEGLVKEQEQRQKEMEERLASQPENPQPDDERRPGQPGIQPIRPMGQPNTDNTRSTDLEKWQQKALKRIKSGRGMAFPFTSDAIDPVTHAAIGAALECATSEQDVKSIFADIWMGYP